jgi:hypothetical protein
MFLPDAFRERLVKMDNCWEWTGATTSNGYGRFRGRRVHRIAYEWATDRPIPPDMVVRHKCDNRLCCRPSHLELGTKAQNTRDAIDRGRFAVAEKHGRTKLTAEDVWQIRASDMPGAHLARHYGMSPSGISRIRSGRSWRFSGPETPTYGRANPLKNRWARLGSNQRPLRCQRTALRVV